MLVLPADKGSFFSTYSPTPVASPNWKAIFLARRKGCLLVVSICLSSVTSPVGHLFIYLLAACVYTGHFGCFLLTNVRSSPWLLF